MSFHNVGTTEVTSQVFRHDWADSYVDSHYSIAPYGNWTSIEPSPNKLKDSKNKESWTTHARAVAVDDNDAYAYLRVEIPTWLLKEYLGYTTFVRLEFSLRCNQQYAYTIEPYIVIDVAKWLKDALISTIQDYVSEDVRYYVFSIVGRWLAPTKAPEFTISLYAESKYRHQVEAFFDGYVEVYISSDLCTDRKSVV